LILSVESILDGFCEPSWKSTCI